MKHIKFAEANMRLKAPEGWDAEKNGECADLFVFAKDGKINSVWVPTPEELALLNAGGGVVLTVFGSSQPAVAVWAVDLAPVDKSKAPAEAPEEEEESVQAVEEPHKEVAEPRNGAQALSPEDEHDTIEEVAAKNSRQHG